jgi:AbrB family looped-hinge helix DNA binding protein
MQANQSTVTRRWQTVIPAAVRKQLNIQAGDVLTWINDGISLRVVLVPANPLSALYGRGAGQGLGAKLLAERAVERKRERARGR